MNPGGTFARSGTHGRFRFTPGKLQELLNVDSALLFKPIEEFARVIPEIGIPEFVEVGFQDRVGRVVHPGLSGKISNQRRVELGWTAMIQRLGQRGAGSDD